MILSSVCLSVNLSVCFSVRLNDRPISCSKSIHDNALNKCESGAYSGFQVRGREVREVSQKLKPLWLYDRMKAFMFCAMQSTLGHLFIRRWPNVFCVGVGRQLGAVINFLYAAARPEMC